jgi:hypothetical protein
MIKNIAALSIEIIYQQLINKILILSNVITLKTIVFLMTMHFRAITMIC